MSQVGYLIVSIPDICPISNFEPPHLILVLIVRGQMQHLIPQVDAAVLAFVFICILTLCIRAANAVMCLISYFHRLAWAFIVRHWVKNQIKSAC